MWEPVDRQNPSALKIQLSDRLDRGRVCTSGGTGLFECPAEIGICSGHGQKCSPEADRRAGIRRARPLSRRSGKTEHIYGEVHDAARKWSFPRRVVIKAEVVRAPRKDPKDNPRFVITNMKQGPQLDL